MNLAELKEAYKAKKLAFDTAKKEEEKYKALLKDAMLEAGESDYTDEAGYRFERIVQERKSMDEEKLLAELHERNLTSCIATKEVVDEDATLKAVEAGELPQEVLADALQVTEVITKLGSKWNNGSNCSFNLNGNNTSGNRNRNISSHLLYVHIKIKENQRNMCSL